ncbi:MAG: hypothetical protein IPL99_26315, partial [Candidatus Competibacteraceae bacterium]|nr:hypothetical protein [Candidatus Competibacteraceae bacterium]
RRRLPNREAELNQRQGQANRRQVTRHFDPGFVTARLLLTQGELHLGNCRAARSQVRGVAVFGFAGMARIAHGGRAVRLTLAQAGTGGSTAGANGEGGLERG